MATDLNRDNAGVALLLGKPPRPGTLLAVVTEQLVAAGVTVHCFLPHEEPVAVDVVAEVASLVVHRGLDEVAFELVVTLQARGLSVCNPVAGVRLVIDRLDLDQRLRAAGIPTPSTSSATTWAQVRSLVTVDSVVKARHCRVGRGAGVIRVSGAALPTTAPIPGPWLVQPNLPGDGYDLKLYVAGNEVAGLVKPSPLGDGHVPGGGRPIVVDPDHVTLARAVRAAVDLDICGVDLLVTPTGPVVVDVNPFPGFRGVPDGAAMVSRHLLDLLGTVPPHPRRGMKPTA